MYVCCVVSVESGGFCGGAVFEFETNDTSTANNDRAYQFDAIAGANATLVWDAENRLIEVKNGATTAATYQYDYLGRRITKTVGAVTTRYIYDG